MCMRECVHGCVRMCLRTWLGVLRTGNGKQEIRSCVGFLTRLHKHCHDSPVRSVTLHRFLPTTQLAACAGHVTNTKSNRPRCGGDFDATPPRCYDWSTASLRGV